MTIQHPWKGHYMEGAFLGFVSFAASHLMKQFEAECGSIKLATSGIDRMIDEATGHDLAEVQRFVDWCVVQFGAPKDLEIERET
ncbi:MAG: hypothetical protein JJ902_03805 [Roseibium sp.]|nr:hypothetical protein [Roseibium sp.]